MSINNTIILAVAKWSVMSDVLRLLNTEYFYSYPKTLNLMRIQSTHIQIHTEWLSLMCFSPQGDENEDLPWQKPVLRPSEKVI